MNSSPALPVTSDKPELSKYTSWYGSAGGVESTSPDENPEEDSLWVNSFTVGAVESTAVRLTVTDWLDSLPVVSIAFILTSKSLFPSESWGLSNDWISLKDRTPEFSSILNKAASNPPSILQVTVSSAEKVKIWFAFSGESVDEFMSPGSPEGPEIIGFISSTSSTDTVRPCLELKPASSVAFI